MPTKNQTLESKIPFKEILKTIPGVFGIRLDEEPSYRIIQRDGSFELRQYEKNLMAQVLVNGDHEIAVEEGFNRLANYIFGQNRTNTAFSMTSPVYQERVSVYMNHSSIHHDRKPDSWLISFVIPSKFDIRTVPKPLDHGICLAELPKRLIASVTYSGVNTEEKMRKGSKQLLNCLKNSRLKAISDVRWAQYDPPFAIPLFRKNEAQVDVVGLRHLIHTL